MNVFIKIFVQIIDVNGEQQSIMLQHFCLVLIDWALHYNTAGGENPFAD